MPGPAARPGTSRLVVVTNLVIVKNVRHRPSPFVVSPARMCREFRRSDPAGFFQYASSTAPGRTLCERYAHLASRP
jgi:hypothetical protein